MRKRGTGRREKEDTGKSNYVGNKVVADNVTSVCNNTSTVERTAVSGILHAVVEVVVLHDTLNVTVLEVDTVTRGVVDLVVRYVSTDLIAECETA